MEKIMYAKYMYKTWAIFLACSFSFHTIMGHSGKTFLATHASKSYFLHDQTKKDWYAKFRSLDTSKISKTHVIFDIKSFYQESTNKSNLGRYFGINDSNTITFADHEKQETDVFYGYLIHRATVGTWKDALSLRLSQYSYGARFLCALNASKILKGLSCNVSIPVTSVHNKISTRFNPEGFDPTDNTKQLEQFLFGDFSETDASTNQLQAPLTHAKLRHKNHATGVSDIKTEIAYCFQKKKNIAATYGIYLTLPMGNKASGKFIFEPIYGNNRHVEIGDFLALDWIISNKKNDKFSVRGALHYAYLFANHQTRTPSIKGYNFGYYYLLGKNNTPKNTPLIPAANVLTTNVSVRPGSKLEASFAGRYTHKRWAFELGYSLFVQENERVTPTQSWPEETYAIANEIFQTNQKFGESDDNFITHKNNWLKLKDLDFTAAATPAQIIHTIQAGVQTSISTSKSSALRLYGTGYYRIPSQNSALELWGIACGVSLEL